MKKQTCSHEGITARLLPLPTSFRGRLATFLQRDFKLKRDTEQILGSRKKIAWYSRWKEIGDCKGVFALLHELKSVLHSKNEYFLPDDSFFVVVQAYGGHPPEIYEFLRDVFFRKDASYRHDSSDLHMGVPRKINTMSMGQLIHHFKLLKSIRRHG